MIICLEDTVYFLARTTIVSPFSSRCNRVLHQLIFPLVCMFYFSNSPSHPGLYVAVLQLLRHCFTGASVASGEEAEGTTTLQYARKIVKKSWWTLPVRRLVLVTMLSRRFRARVAHQLQIREGVNIQDNVVRLLLQYIVGQVNVSQPETIADPGGPQAYYCEERVLPASIAFSKPVRKCSQLVFGSIQVLEGGRKGRAVKRRQFPQSSAKMHLISHLPADSESSPQMAVGVLACQLQSSQRGPAIEKSAAERNLRAKQAFLGTSCKPRLVWTQGWLLYFSVSSSQEFEHNIFNAQTENIRLLFSNAFQTMKLMIFRWMSIIQESLCIVVAVGRSTCNNPNLKNW